ncbi:MAG: IS110 family transposase [Acidimicrobiia bacterium]|nr:IS110 family transposase [Acidimicrobiia bacterium]MDH5520411.1 IS110 family transposase [Acidimicrobiia bacterium]
MSIVTHPLVIDNPVAGGVDTHADVHVAAVIDHVGRELGHNSFPTTTAGYAALGTWLAGHGTITVVGVEGTGVYGAGLARSLTAEGLNVVEVDRPDRKSRRLDGKSDPLDAYAAARAALSGRATGTPKSRDGNVEMIRTLRVARSSAIKARAVAITQLKAVIKTAPDDLRAELRDLGGATLINRCARLRPARGQAPVPSPHAKRKPRPGRLLDIAAATKHTLATLARRVHILNDEITGLDDDLTGLVDETAPTLTAMFGVGTDIAGQLLATIGDNPERIATSAAFAHLCGVAPIPATSGKIQNRHRLNSGGDRHANCALYRIVMSRLRYEPRTQTRRDELCARGKTNQDIIRILKRAIAREVYQAIKTDLITIKNGT